jgi:hypothetical protein
VELPLDGISFSPHASLAGVRLEEMTENRKRWEIYTKDKHVGGIGFADCITDFFTLL